MNDEAGAAIVRLSDDVISQIRSSITITSLTDVVAGLIENALDAQATKIDVTIDFARGGCIVEDNGYGIMPHEFGETGKLGRMYCTAKDRRFHDRELHGTHGVFLSALAALSLFTITSKHCQYRSQNSITMHRSKTIARNQPAPTHQQIVISRDHGSRVSVRDLFGDIPVRVKQRTLSAASRSNFQTQWDILKKHIVALALAWPKPVTLNVKDMAGTVRGFTLSNKAFIHLGEYHEPIQLHDVASLLVKSGYLPSELQSGLVPASVSTPAVNIKGFISKDPMPSRNAQFLSFGIHPYGQQTEGNEMYDFVNRIFEDSDFGAEGADVHPDATEVERRRRDRRYKVHGPTTRQLRGGGKGVDRWPLFCLCIDVKNSGQNTSMGGWYDPDDVNTLQLVIVALKALFVGWLKAHNFQPHKSKSERKSLVKSYDPYSLTDSTITTGRLCDIAESENPRTQYVTPNSRAAFADWSRIKSSKSAINSQFGDVERSSSSTTLSPCVSNVAARPISAASRSSSLAVEPLTLGQYNGTTGLQSLASTISRRADKECQHVDDSYALRNGDFECRDSTSIVSSRLTITGRAVELQQPCKNGILETPHLATRFPSRPHNHRQSELRYPSTWVEELVQGWNNPRFATPTEQPVTRIPTVETTSYAAGCRHDKGAHIYLNPGNQSMVGSRESQLSKSALSQAKVISQVDQKYILIKLTTTGMQSSDNLAAGQPTLVLVDQHAASERYILERLFSELCTLPTTTESLASPDLGLASAIATSVLDKPMHFQISSAERDLFGKFASHFAFWGILYDIRSPDALDDLTSVRQTAGRIIVLTLPPCIQERCITEPKLTIDLLRKEIWARADPAANHHIEPTTDTNDIQHGWLRRIGSCPRGMIDLLNSRACRSAVMFNDKLSTFECETLIRNLAECAFPFICAHGRISMVPLVNLDGGDHDMEATREGCCGDELKSGRSQDSSFSIAMKQWQEKKK